MLEEIEYHCINNDRYGFTIPYLFKIEKENFREKNIYEILEFLSKSDNNYIITKCDDLDEFIIGLPKKEYAPLSFYKNFGNLFYDQDELGDFENLEDLSFFLSCIYQKFIDDGTYSKNIETLKWE